VPLVNVRDTLSRLRTPEVHVPAESRTKANVGQGRIPKARTSQARVFELTLFQWARLMSALAGVASKKFEVDGAGGTVRSAERTGEVRPAQVRLLKRRLVWASAA
jgi:hypothetical protein